MRGDDGRDAAPAAQAASSATLAVAINAFSKFWNRFTADYLASTSFFRFSSPLL